MIRKATARELGEAVALHQRGEVAEAVRRYEKLISGDPDNPDLLNLLGIARYQTGEPVRGLPLVERAVELSPRSVNYRESLSTILAVLGRFEEAVPHLEEMVLLDSGAVNACLNLSKYLRDLRRHREGIHYAERGLTIASDNAGLHNNLGNLFLDTGHLEKAREAYAKAVEIDPCFGQAWANLSTTRRYREEDRPEIGRMEATTRQLAGSDRGNSGQIEFALGKAYADLGEPGKAMDHYGKANALVRNPFPWDPFERYLEAVRNTFTREFLARPRDPSGPPCDSPLEPVFIVGMLRSGTSLLEQILSMHPLLAGVGERPELAKLTHTVENYPAEFGRTTGAGRQKLAREYTRLVSEFHPPGQRSVDKMMTNFLHLGFIASLFPGAKVIHISRHPGAVGLSCFVQNFAFESTWTTSLEWIGRYYARYREMMKHWREVLPLPVHEVTYEDLVTEPEKEIRRLLDYCGVPWEEDCLSPHRGEHVVQTASNWQVRQPISAAGINKWRAYEPYLEGFFRALEESP